MLYEKAAHQRSESGDDLRRPENVQDERMRPSCSPRSTVKMLPESEVGPVLFSALSHFQRSENGTVHGAGATVCFYCTIPPPTQS